MALGAIIGAVGGLLGSRSQNRSNERIAERSYQESREGLLLGNQLDIDSQKEMFDFRMGRMRQAGLTNVEMFGSPAAGAGGGTSGSGAVLGNAASQRATSQIAANSQMQAQMSQAMLGAGTALEQTKMQTDAQKEVAKIQAGATTGAATISAESNQKIANIVNDMAQKNLDLKTREFEEYMLEKLEVEQGVAKAQIKKLLNEAEFTPELKREITKMTMGVSNSVNLMLQKRFGIDVTSEEQMQKLSPQQMKNVLSVFMAADSNLYSEIAGLLGAAAGDDDFTLDPVMTDGNVLPEDSQVPNLGNVPKYNSAQRRRERRRR